MGTHHTKYFMSIDPTHVHVLVTTSNITPSHGVVDGFWTQSFPRVEAGKGGGDFGKTFVTHLKHQVYASICSRAGKSNECSHSKGGNCALCCGGRCGVELDELLGEVGMTVDGLLTDVDWETEVELIVSRPGDHANEEVRRGRGARRSSRCSVISNEINTLITQETSLNNPDCEGKVKHLLCGGKQVAKALEEHGLELKPNSKCVFQPTSIGNNVDAKNLHSYVKELTRGEVRNISAAPPPVAFSNFVSRSLRTTKWSGRPRRSSTG